MNRRTFLGSLAASPLFAQSKKPNIVILYADDLGFNDVGFNGRKEWSTPNLDRIASEGTIFERWYTAYPLCCPSRAALLTGRYGIHTTVRDNRTDIPRDETTLAEALKPLGYRTALIGKWHKGQEPTTHPLDQGFDETYGYADAREAWEHFPKKLWRGRQQEEVTGYSCDILAAEAQKFIMKNKANPFFLYVPFIEPHFWIESPEENVKKYQGKFTEKDPTKPYNAHYAGMIERLDAAIGRIVKTIDDAGLGKDTIIMFSSDNGATFEDRTYGATLFHDSNRPFRGQKRSLEEGGIRVPGFVRWTDRVPGKQRSNTVVHMTDVFPSMLAVAGEAPKPDWKVDGTNMLDVWTGKSNGPDRAVFWEFTVEGWQMYAGMRGDWKYLQIGEGNVNQWLYNVKEDPEERRNRSGEHPEIFKSLQAEVRAWMQTAQPR